MFAEPGKTQSDVPRQAEGYKVFLSAGGGCVCPGFLCCPYRQGLNTCFTVTTTFSSTDIQRMPFFFLYFNQGPQRRRKEGDSSGASGDRRAQQTSHDRFNEGGTSFQSQGGSREHWVQAPAVGRHTRIIQQLRKSNPLYTRVEPVVNLFELCAVQAPSCGLVCSDGGLGGVQGHASTLWTNKIYLVCFFY